MKKTAALLLLISVFTACKKSDEIPGEVIVNEDPATYKEIASLNLGGLGSAEITTFDPQTKRLFAVNNGTVNKIDVIDIVNPASITLVHSINLGTYGGYVNSVDVSNGKLAAAIESATKQNNGKVVVFNTTTYAEEKVITVGALPDMVVYSPDGKYILSANEGEPDAPYTNDPEGSVSIISVENNYSVTTLNFASFAPQLTALKTKGFRVFGPGNDIAKDVEPEYISVSSDSRTAWVTLQENNAIAVIDIATKTITKILPLGFKDYNVAAHAIDPSDKEGGINFNPWKVYGTYMPDAVASLNYNGIPYLFTANEGDAREYTGFSELKRVKDIALDATAFPDAVTLKQDIQLGRLNITTTLGDTDGDGDFDALYGFGARSFSVWNGNTGDLVYDSRNELDVKAKDLGIYDDNRSDDKGTEPEAITLGKVGTKTIAFVGMERADAIAVYDVTNPTAPVFIKMFATGDAPEGVLFIPASKSPIQQSLVVVSSENDGAIKIYKADKL
ncbi:MAG: choice-of-anchor I family protein [Chitinophagaceae bacterium]|nr:choice-of-anchor I family protein [Chitinophagaceae bacterium]